MQAKFVAQGYTGDALVTMAVHRLDEGFRFVGITDEWETTVCLFHRMHMHDRPCLPVEFLNNRPSDVLPGTQIMNSSLGSEVLKKAGFIDQVDTLFFEAVQRIFNMNKMKYNVTPAACAQMKCTTGSHELSLHP